MDRITIAVVSLISILCLMWTALVFWGLYEVIGWLTSK